MGKQLPLAASACALALAGCAALPWPSGFARSAGRTSAGEWLDLRGVVHVHTRGSHDSPGTIGAIVDAAHSAGLVWVALTEHPKRSRFAPSAGVIEGVTILPGWELPRAGGSILALGVAEGWPRASDVAELASEIRARGGVALAGHFERSSLREPEAYARAGLDGFELVNLHAIALTRPLRLVLGELLLPAPLALRSLLATPSANLEAWNRLRGVRTLVGGVDAHAKFRALGPAGGTLDRYRDLFRLVTTHALARDATPEALLEALRAGRTYVAFEGRAPVERFVFSAGERGYRIEAPREARLELWCDGALAGASAGRALELAAPAGAEACHARAWLGSELWVATSPIARASHTVARSVSRSAEICFNRPHGSNDRER